MPRRTPTSERLLELVDRFADATVLFLADLIADRFVTGEPKRISREAPVLILRHRETLLVPGGGANAVANCCTLGGRPRVFGFLGDDASGYELSRQLGSLGADLAGVEALPGYRTPTKTRILGGGRHSVKQQIVRIDREEPVPISAEEALTRLDARLDVDPQPGVVVLSDYGYGSATPELAARLKQRCPGARLLCDSRYRLSAFPDLEGATPNEDEAEALAGERLGEGSDVLGPGRRLRAELGSSHLLVTRGSAGMALFVAEGAALIPISGSDEVADVTGAGDTVMATFSLALASGADPLEAALLANYAGGAVVMKKGTVALCRDELRAVVEAGAELLGSVRWVDV